MEFEWKGESPAPEFDQALADSYVGKYILVGISYFDIDGNFLSQEQMHGTIASASPDGIAIALRGAHDGESFVIPPTLESILAADPGTYTLHASGEEVENPDLMVTWDIQKPRQH